MRVSDLYHLSDFSNFPKPPKVHKILIEDEFCYLNFAYGRLATRDEYETEDRCVGSIFEVLEPGELIELAEGVFMLDADLDLIVIS